MNFLLTAAVSDIGRPELEKSFVMIKPDGVQRCLIGPIVGKFQEKGFKLRAMKLIHVCYNYNMTHINFLAHNLKHYDGFRRFSRLFSLILLQTQIIDRNVIYLFVYDYLALTHPNNVISSR